MKEILQIARKHNKTIEVYTHEDQAMLKIDTVFLAKLTAKEAQDLKKFDYKRPVVDLTEDETRYRAMLYEFNKLASKQSTERVTFTGFRYDTTAVGHVNRNYLVCIDEIYKDIAEILCSRDYVTANQNAPIFYWEFDNSIRCIIAPITITEVGDFAIELRWLNESF